MSRSRLPLILGLTAAGGVGYYLYSAGGNPKVAEKKFESDVHKASAKVKGELPGRVEQAQTKGKEVGAQLGAKYDSAVAGVNKEISKSKSEAEAWGKNVKADATKKIDEFDRKVEDGAAKAKSGVSSWFGGK